MSGEWARRPRETVSFNLRIGFTALLGTLGAICTSTGTMAQQKVVVYSSNDDTLHKLVFAAFSKETGIAVEPISAGSGVIIKRIQTEKDRPGGDIIWGVSRSLLETNKAYFAPYVPRTATPSPRSFASRAICGSATTCT